MIPAYNAEAFVSDAIDSALAQTYPHVEVIVVDDGSTDSTAAVLETYRDRVTVLSQPNQGPAAARNHAISVARGSFIGFLDADDRWLPERVSTMIGELLADPSTGLITSDALILEDGALTGARFYPDVLGFDFAYDHQLQRIAEDNFVHVGAIIRRELFDRYGLLDESLRGTEDYDLWIRFLLGGERIGFVPEALAYYHVRSDSLSADRARQRDKHLLTLAKHLGELWRRGVRSRPGEIYAIARVYERLGRRRQAVHAYLLGARDDRLSRGARTKQLGAAARCAIRPRRAGG